MLGFDGYEGPEMHLRLLLANPFGLWVYFVYVCPEIQSASLKTIGSHRSKDPAQQNMSSFYHGHSEILGVK